jgi:hypothetical protein
VNLTNKGTFMNRSILFVAFVMAMLVVGTATKAHAWGYGGYRYGGYRYGGYSAGRVTTVSDNSVSRYGYASGPNGGAAYGYHSYSGGYGGGYAAGGYHYGGAYGGYSAGAYRRW